MASLHIRDVPDDIHGTLADRAAAAGVSLRAYVVGILEEHCALPTLDEWLDELAQLPPVPHAASGAELVEQARNEDDQRLADVLDRRR